MDCDCNIPSCKECFIKYAKATEKMGHADKELFYEWMALVAQEKAEDDLWDMIVRHYNPDQLAELLKNPNEW